MGIKIACLSDTHGHLDERLIGFIGRCDEIWHAGDIGSPGVADKLEAIKPLRAVYGNIDDQRIRDRFPLHQRFECGGLQVWITHIGGYPGRYDAAVRSLLKEDPPDIFICGHSHILRIMYDKELEMMLINPGAAGRTGMHTVQTAVRFVIDNKRVCDPEIIEMERRRSVHGSSG